MQAEDNEKKGKLRIAVEDFKAALAVDPNHLAHNVHLQLGLCKVLVKLGRGKEALSSCNEALNIDGELLEALVQVCWCFYFPSFIYILLAYCLQNCLLCNILRCIAQSVY